MNRRVAVNLTTFAVMGLALAWWAVNNVLQIDVVDKPYTITADFESSPGLQPGFDVGYLGTPIGRVREVTLEDGGVSVVMAIEKGREIPEGSSLAVRRKSAIGEPYVDVVPPEGATTDGPALEAGAHIPRERTSTPLAYAELFEALDTLVSAVPEEDLNTLLHELALGLDGRSEDLRRLITGSSDALDTFAENSVLIEDFTANMADLVGTLAEHRTQLGEGLDNAALVTGSLSAANADLQRVLRDGDTLANRTADLLAGSKPEVTCILGDLAELTVRLGRPDLLGAIDELLATGPAARAVFQDQSAGGVIANEDDGPYVRAIPPLNIGGSGEPVPVYDSPRQLPEIPAVAGCPDLDAVNAPAGSSVADSAGVEGATGDSPAVDPGAPTDEAREQASSQQQNERDPFNPFVIVFALLAFAAVAAIRPWRWLPRRGDG
jgi:phospholipid/cholesterol/gamma-HCH transport system substrate-binding protein